MHWGNSIVLSFLLFAAFIFTMVIIGINQDVDLVTENYYQDEVKFQKHLEKRANVYSLEESLELIVDRTNKRAVLVFPKSQFSQEMSGTIHFFRPSDASMDRKTPLILDRNLSQQLDLSNLQMGFWRLKISWSYAGKEYYDEKTLTL